MSGGNGSMEVVALVGFTGMHSYNTAPQKSGLFCCFSTAPSCIDIINIFWYTGFTCVFYKQKQRSKTKQNISA